MPTWNAGLGFWESHEAVDYQMKDDAVVSLTSGVVCAVGRNGIWGGFVEVTCGDAVLRYASIAPRSDLSLGDALLPGDVIGQADTSMPGEAELGAHLHLELQRDGVAEDFVSWQNGD